MSRLVKSLAHLLPELARTLFGKRVTVHFPFAPLELPAYFRGKVVVRPELCVGCGLCARDCPALALELKRESREQFRLIHHHDRCAYCGQCEDSCRHGAITLVNEFVPATARRDTLTRVEVERGTSTGQNPDEASNDDVPHGKPDDQTGLQKPKIARPPQMHWPDDLE